MSDSLRPPCPWISPGKNTGVGSHSLLQGLFLTQGSNLGLLHCRQILYHVSHWGSPRITTGLVKTVTGKLHSRVSDTTGPEWDHRICMFNEFPSDTTAAGLGVTH